MDNQAESNCLLHLATANWTIKYIFYRPFSLPHSNQDWISGRKRMEGPKILQCAALQTCPLFYVSVSGQQVTGVMHIRVLLCQPNMLFQHLEREWASSNTACTKSPLSQITCCVCFSIWNGAGTWKIFLNCIISTERLTIHEGIYFR